MQGCWSFSLPETDDLGGWEEVLGKEDRVDSQSRETVRDCQSSHGEDVGGRLSKLKASSELPADSVVSALP